jgi:hypothetical protein
MCSRCICPYTAGADKLKISKEKLNTNTIVMKMKNKVTILILPLLLLCSAGAFAENTFNINEAPVNIAESGTYIITGTGDETANTITVSSDVTACITIQNVNINNDEYSSAFRINEYATVNLTLSGNNILKSGIERAGLQVYIHATLIINGTSDDTLEAIGNDTGAGIGTDNGDGGTVIINGGTITATGGRYGAGIGGGDGTFCQVIIINGGTITAYGINGNPGIGQSESLIIRGGTVKATSDSGSDIRNATEEYPIVISGGSIYAGSIDPQPTNGNGEDVYRNTLIVGGSSNGEESVMAGSINENPCTTDPDKVETDSYGIKGVKTDSGGQVYFYLPASDDDETITLTVDGVSYTNTYTRKANDDDNIVQLAVAYGISLNKSGTQSFTIPYGYSAPTPLSVTVSNIAVNATGDLGVDLSGADAGSFELSTSSLASIAISGTSDFTVKLNTDLSVGTYTATVTVSGANDISESFDVSFTVVPKSITVSKDLEDAIVCVGESHTFGIEAEGDNLTYEWYYGNERIKGANGNTCTITNAELRDYERYYVIVRSQSGDYRSSIYSKNVRLWVADQLPESLQFVEFPSPVITGKTYRIKLAGYPDVTQYVWSYSNDGVTFSPATGSVGQNETMATFGVLSEGLGTLTATLTHPCGTREATQTIRVNYPTGIEEVTVNEIAVSPNPTQGIIKISGTKSNQIIHVVDITGSLKGTYPARDGETTIDLTGYNKGTYLVQYDGKTVKVIRK